MELRAVVTKSAKGGFVGLLAVFTLAAVMVRADQGQVQHHPPLSHSQKRLALAADVTSRNGFQAKLPPHISTLLGLSNEQECPVMQSVVREGNLVKGFDVSLTNKNDIVLFVVDETAKDQTLYLTSPEGTLRKVVSVKGGMGKVTRATDDDRKAFQKEKQSWVDRLVPTAAAK
jgi:hypothetical protein